MKFSSMFFALRVAGFLVSIGGDRELSVDDLHKAIDHVSDYIDPDGDGVILQTTDLQTLKSFEGFLAALSEATEDGNLSVADLHRIIDDTSENHSIITGKPLSFKF